ncbi:MAG: LysR family transcriptional regulator [Clostridia bacterium]|nr:LysR family transcriptional regulator [Clostridia bacterium]
MIQLFEMKYVVTLAMFGNFTKAAKALYISQPSLSLAIKKLEGKLGLVLFDRQSPSLKLTPEGEYFVREATNLLNMSDTFEKNMQNLISGAKKTINFGISPFYGRYYLPKLISNFKQECPTVDVSIMEHSSVELEISVLENNIDFCFLPLPLKHKNLKYKPVFEEKIYIAVPRNCALVPKLPPIIGSDIPMVELDLFRNMPFVFLKDKQRFTTAGVKICEEYGFKPNIVFKSDDWDTIDAMISKGLGVGFVPEVLVNTNDPDKPLYYRFRSSQNARQYVMAYKNAQKITPEVETLIRIMSSILEH